MVNPMVVPDRIEPKPLVWNRFRISIRYNPNTDSNDQYKVLGSKQVWKVYVNESSLGSTDSLKNAKRIAQQHADRQVEVWNNKA